MALSPVCINLHPLSAPHDGLLPGLVFALRENTLDLELDTPQLDDVVLLEDGVRLGEGLTLLVVRLK